MSSVTADIYILWFFSEGKKAVNKAIVFESDNGQYVFMSYNKRTGVFNLTQTKARYWYRKDYDASIPGPGATIPYFAELLRRAGLEVVEVYMSHLEVKATPGKIWEALSGQPSDPQRESYYL